MHARKDSGTQSQARPPEVYFLRKKALPIEPEPSEQPATPGANPDANDTRNSSGA
jgi:hypothetical protein